MKSIHKIVMASLLVTGTSMIADVVNLDNLLDQGIVKLEPGVKSIPLPYLDTKNPDLFTGKLYTFTPTEGPAKGLPIYFYILRSQGIKGHDVYTGKETTVDGFIINILAPGNFNPATQQWSEGVFEKYVKTKKGIPAKFAEYSAALQKTAPGNIYNAMTYKITGAAVDAKANELKGELTAEGTFLPADKRDGGPLPVPFGYYMVQPNVLSVTE